MKRPAVCGDNFNSFSSQARQPPSSLRMVRHSLSRRPISTTSATTRLPSRRISFACSARTVPVVSAAPVMTSPTPAGDGLAAARGELGLGLLELDELRSGRVLARALPCAVGLVGNTNQLRPEPHFGRPEASLAQLAEIKRARDAMARAELIDCAGADGLVGAALGGTGHRKPPTAERAAEVGRNPTGALLYTSEVRTHLGFHAQTGRCCYIGARPGYVQRNLRQAFSGCTDLGHVAPVD